MRLPDGVTDRLPTTLGQLRRWTVGIVVGLRQWVRTRGSVEHDNRGEVGALVVPLVGDDAALQDLDAGHGPVHHRTYRVVVHSPVRSAEEVVVWMRREPNDASPSAFALFEPLTRTGDDDLGVGTDHVVLLPGPWDGPVRVVGDGPAWFRLATLPGHLEAGEIEFRAEDLAGGAVEITIESWARAGDPVMKVLHHDLAIARAVQMHMWTEVLRRAADHAGGDPQDVRVLSEHAPLDVVRRVPRP